MGDLGLMVKPRANFRFYTPPVYLVLSHDKQAHALQMPQVARGHMPRFAVVPLFVLIEHIILHLLLPGVSECAAHQPR